KPSQARGRSRARRGAVRLRQAGLADGRAGLPGLRDRQARTFAALRISAARPRGSEVAPALHLPLYRAFAAATLLDHAGLRRSFDASGPGKRKCLPAASTGAPEQRADGDHAPALRGEAGAGRTRSAGPRAPRALRSPRPPADA